MDRLAALLVTAEELRGATFRALPWAYRVAHVVRVMVGTGTGDVFGRYVGALFLTSGVEGMPDPGPKWDPTARDPVRTLPVNYYRDFGDKAVRILTRKFGDFSVVEDALMNAMSLVAAKKVRIQEGTARSRAEAYVMTTLVNEAKRIMRERYRMPQESLTRDETDDIPFELEDTDALDEYERMFSVSDMKAIRQALGRVAPWAPMYLDMVLEGYDDAEIIGDPIRNRPSLLARRLGVGDYLPTTKGLPMSVGSWSKPGGYKSQIREVIERTQKRLAR